MTQTLSATFIAFGLLSSAGCQQQSTESTGETEQRPENAAPELVLEHVDGSGVFSLAEHKSKVVLVDLWATWCVPCIAELPHLQALSEELPAEDFLMVGIVLESGEREEIVAFLEQREITYPQVLGEEETAESFGPFLGYPTKYLIDRDGLVVKRYFGKIGTELADDVKALIETGALVESGD
jgi:thiol-disulfide isomerase/thioredoxin